MYLARTGRSVRSHDWQSRHGVQWWPCSALAGRGRASGDVKHAFSVPQINPHHRWAQLWDGFTALTLVYVALAVPFEVAFLDDELLSANWVLGRVIDLVRSVALVSCPGSDVYCVQQHFSVIYVIM